MFLRDVLQRNGYAFSAKTASYFIIYSCIASSSTCMTKGNLHAYSFFQKIHFSSWIRMFHQIRVVDFATLLKQTFRLKYYFNFGRENNLNSVIRSVRVSSISCFNESLLFNTCSAKRKENLRKRMDTCNTHILFITQRR